MYARGLRSCEFQCLICAMTVSHPVTKGARCLPKKIIWGKIEKKNFTGSYILLHFQDIIYMTK